MCVNAFCLGHWESFLDTKYQQTEQSVNGLLSALKLHLTRVCPWCGSLIRRQTRKTIQMEYLLFSAHGETVVAEAFHLPWLGSLSRSPSCDVSQEYN